MQQWLGVTVRLLAAFQYQRAGRTKRDARIEVGAHGFVARVALVLPVHDLGHAPERRHDLLPGRDPVQQPVGNVLARDPQRRTILHEPDVIDVRHLGAPDALVDPAHHVAENALRVVVEFRLDRFRRQAAEVAERRRQDVVQAGEFAGCERLLARAHVDGVVMHCVQGRGGR